MLPSTALAAAQGAPLILSFTVELCDALLPKATFVKAGGDGGGGGGEKAGGYSEYSPAPALFAVSAVMAKPEHACAL